jgi:hypothetical protein
VGQVVRLFRVEARARRFVRWIELRIGESIIDRVQAGRSGVTQIRDLDGRGFSRQDEQPVTRHVQGEVDENVDGVVADLLSCFVVGKTGDVVPAIGFGADLGGDVIGHCKRWSSTSPQSRDDRSPPAAAA